MGRLNELDLDTQVFGPEYRRQLAQLQKRMTLLRLHLGGHMGSGQLGPGLLCLFEGPDAAGKGGAIKRLVQPLDPRHYRVDSFSAPTFDEKRHHFLWRFYKKIPGHGGMVCFDRSWYGRVLVERVEGFATDEQWGRAYEEIVAFERTMVQEGMILVKFWVHIDADEQLARFEARKLEPLKAWKLTDEDYRNREKWDDYTEAAEDMFARTDHEHAEWTVVPGNSKKHARLEVLRATIAAVEDGMKQWDMEVPG